MKSSENMLLAGSAGAYLLRLMDITDDYKELFIKFVHLLERYNACTCFFMHMMRYNACTCILLLCLLHYACDAIYCIVCFILHVMRFSALPALLCI